MKKRFAFSFLCMIPFVFLVSCETIDLEKVLFEESREEKKDKELVCRVSFHEIVRYPHGDPMEKKLESLRGKSEIVQAKPLIHSRHIKKVEMTAIKGGEGAYDLSVILDKRGKMLWGQMYYSHKNRRIAMVVDGIIYKAFAPLALEMDPKESKDPPAAVLVRGPFNKKDAEKVVLNSEINYNALNPK